MLVSGLKSVWLRHFCPEGLSDLLQLELPLDTEGGFSVHRANAIAQSMVDRMKERSASENEQFPTAKDLLSKIHFFRIYSHFELLAFIADLPDIIETYPKVTSSRKFT